MEGYAHRSQKQQKVAPGIDGGFVVLGAHTSKMSVAEMADPITLCSAFGHERGVKFSPKTLLRGVIWSSYQIYAKQLKEGN